MVSFHAFFLSFQAIICWFSSSMFERIPFCNYSQCIDGDVHVVFLGPGFSSIYNTKNQQTNVRSENFDTKTLSLSLSL